MNDINAETDINDIPWAKVKEVSAGTIVVTDAGFTCIKEGETRKVFYSDDGLFIRCTHGRHYLDGQLNDQATCYVGLYLRASRKAP